jgi:hypothetical protein
VKDGVAALQADADHDSERLKSALGAVNGTEYSDDDDDDDDDEEEEEEDDEEEEEDDDEEEEEEDDDEYESEEEDEPPEAPPAEALPKASRKSSFGVKMPWKK